MDLYARHPETDELALVGSGFDYEADAYEQADLMQADGTWPLSKSNTMFIPVLRCSKGWHWLCSANLADLWLPGGGTLEERLVYGGYRAVNPLPAA